jgi:hypothetical protein
VSRYFSSCESFPSLLSFSLPGRKY